jgi:glutamate synthase (NADPH/NADH) small chain
MCARVCPTEVLCEEACVRNTHEEQPVRIGLLQRYATDPVFKQDIALFERAADSGRKVAVVGAGPAGLSCAHRLAMLGHGVVLFNRDPKPGGLNEYGIAAYKTVDDFAQREVQWILDIGGIELRNDVSLGEDFTLGALMDEYDAVFLGIGLGEVNRLGIENEDLDGVIDAVEYIAKLRQTRDKGSLPVGNRVVVIGGGMTAIDIAVQSKRLGAGHVDMFYRRGPEQMGASKYEQQFAQTSGVSIHHWSRPLRILGKRHVNGVEFERTALDAGGKLRGTGESRTIEADVVFKAVGQILGDGLLDSAGSVLKMHDGRVSVGGDRSTSIKGVWAGGDCVDGGKDLTVTAVQDGKVAAHSIDRYLRKQ